MTVHIDATTQARRRPGVAASVVDGTKVYGKGATEGRALDNVGQSAIRHPAWTRTDPYAFGGAGATRRKIERALVIPMVIQSIELPPSGPGQIDARP
jgi:hypothetical protein